MKSDTETGDSTAPTPHPHSSIVSAIPISPRLPQELCDTIIDELGAMETYHPYGEIDWDTESRPLKRCALVCRGWRPRAQFWLFRYVSLGSLRSLRKLESQLGIREDLLQGVHEIHIGCQDGEGYPAESLPSAVATLARRCPNLKVLSLQRTGHYELDEDDSPHHPYLPFHSRLHSALFRQSFCSIVKLSISSIKYHSDTDFLTFIFSFVSLEELFLDFLHFDILHKIKERDYILLLKKRKGIFARLRHLYMFNMEPDVFCAILEALPNNRLQVFGFNSTFPRDDVHRAVDVSRFTLLSRMIVHLDMAKSAWEHHEHSAVSSFLRGTRRQPESPRQLILSVYPSPRVTTRQKAISTLETLSKIICSEHTDHSNASIQLGVYHCPFIERLRTPPIKEEIRKMFPESMNIEVDTSKCTMSISLECYNNESGTWSWKPTGSATNIVAAQNRHEYPKGRGRRHSFPPPSSYSPKNAPRWGPNSPQKEYTHGVPFKDGWELSEGGQLLPDSQVFEPPARKGKTKHDFSAHRDWERRTISRRMSGSFEGLLADTETARNPAFIARYRARRDLALQSVV